MIPVRTNLFFTLLFSVALYSSHSVAQTTTNPPADTNAIKTERDTAIGQVEKIVNQMVPAYRRTPGMQVGRFSPGWFHEGAMKPDYNTVDVRTTRETAEYDKSEYCTSDLNPGLVWKSREIEFNSMTKYFYTNRTFPKKRLTEAEMLEINRLYRIIGKCEQQLNPAPKADAGSETDSESAAAPEKRSRLLKPYIGAPVLLILALLLIFMYKRRS